uniref:Uncharacterized protein n=1 Tax=Lepeophtheirus salmonis TaxID=72036 RepID=A0A0K2TWS2_LEPSM
MKIYGYGCTHPSGKNDCRIYIQSIHSHHEDPLSNRVHCSCCISSRPPSQQGTKLLSM